MRARSIRRLSLWLVLAGLFASALASAESRSTKNLNLIADDYYWNLQDRLLRPKYSPQGNAAWMKRIKTFERRLAHVKTANLDQQSRITHKVLGNELKGQRVYITKGWIKEDINGSESLLHTIIGGAEASEGRTINDWKWTIKTLKNSSRFVDSYTKLLRQGLSEGKVRSKPVIRSSISSLGALTSNSTRRNPFLALESQLETSLAGRKQLPKLRRELHKVVRDNVIPAHKRLKTFLAKEYLPHTGKVGQNRERYLYHMSKHLGSDHPSPEALNRWGQREVARLLKQLDKTVRKIDPQARDTRNFMHRLNRNTSNLYASGDELIADTKRELVRSKRIARGMAPIPRSKVKVTRVAPYQEATLAAQYMESGDKVGEMQVNTGKLLKGQRKYDLATLVTHEVWGGHHMAAMYARKQTRLPEYRQGAANTSYDEGWALYSEAWRNSKGKFTPNEQIGYLVNHLWRAARLVVDTGLHTGTMSPVQATKYFQRNTFTDKTNAKAEIERYMNWPGQALAYYHGKRQLLDTKRECRKILGKRFNERRFHAKLLSLGSIPNGEVKRVMGNWARRSKGQLTRHNGPTRRSGFYGRKGHRVGSSTKRSYATRPRHRIKK
jgi:uncharacterized protein (DUF885 family)